jgi:DNA (cytosine-5)-methyltransferase 1
MGAPASPSGSHPSDHANLRCLGASRFDPSRKLRVIDMFAGIGGFSLGLHRAGGFETRAVVEINPYASKVLEQRIGAPNLGDVTKTEFVDADVICAGFPCQDISLAGKGAGLAGARSGLWREVVRAIRVVRPLYVLLENVAALLDRGMGRVLGDLAALRYDAEWDCIPASYIGAWHRRDRIWVVANAHGLSGQQGQSPRALFRQRDVHEQSTRSFARWPGRSYLPKSRLCGGADGVRARLHALGNSVVPFIPEIIGRSIRAAIADTHPKDGDSTQIEAPLVSGGGAQAIAQKS